MNKDAQKIIEKAKRREKAGRNSREVGFQANMELLFLMMKEHLKAHPGQMLPMQIDNEAEGALYLDVQEKLDLPPDACAVFITPSALRSIRRSIKDSTGFMEETESGKNVYSTLIANPDDQTRMMQAYTPGAVSVGIDVYEDGRLLAEYNYKNVEECLDDLSNVTWTFFSPSREEWTEGRIALYTENWFAKSVDNPNLKDLFVRPKYSYLHNPELLDLTPLSAVFSLLRVTIPKMYDSLEKAIENTNELNLDMNLDYPVVTESGVLGRDPDQCRALMGRIEIEMDMSLDEVEELEGVEFSMPWDPLVEYKAAFEKTAKNIFETISGVSYPE